MSAWSHLDFDQIGDLDAMFIGGCVSNQSGPLRVWGPSGKQPELGTNFAIERMREMFTRDLTGRKGKKFVYSGNTVSKCGDAMVRTLLHEAANALLTRCTRNSALKAWATRIAMMRGKKRAKVALARKQAVIMHRMWLDGSGFRWSDKASAAAD